MSDDKTYQELKLFLRIMTNDIRDLRVELGKLKASSPSKFYKELQELKQGSMSVKEYFDELHISMLRAKVKESSKATMDRFLQGLNHDIGKQMHLYPYSDLQGMVSIAIELEKLLKEKERKREQEKRRKEREAREKELEEKRKFERESELTKIIESEREFELTKIIIESNDSEDEATKDVKEETIIDTNCAISSVVLSSPQELDYDASKPIDPYGKDHPQESRATLFQERENDRGKSGVLHCSQGGIIHVNHDVQEEFEQAKDPFHDTKEDLIIITHEVTLGLQIAAIRAHNVIIHAEGVNEALTMLIQAHRHDFAAHGSMSTWESMKVHEIGVT